MTLAATKASRPPGDDLAVCDYCRLPLAPAAVSSQGPLYCCLGCRLAAEITAERGPQGRIHGTAARLGLAVFLSLNVMMFTMALWTEDLYDARAAGSGPLAASLAELFRYLCLVLSLPVLFLLGGPLLESALASRRRAAAATDLLIVLGVSAAYLYSCISVLRGAGHVYFEVGCAVLVMITLGRWLEATGKIKTTEALDALEKLLPDRIRVVQPNGEDDEVALDNLRVGDRLHVLAGERIATDSRVVSGCAGVDQQILTGESRPAMKQPGDLLLGGSLNLDGDLIAEVTTLPRDGSLARLVEMVRRARADKGSYQRMVDRVAHWFLRAVLLIAVATLAWHSWRHGFDQGIMASLAVLLIACPCALGLATPMAVWTAMGAAAQRGVVFRGGDALERLAAVRAICFDKTGTLTTGTPRVERFATDAPQWREVALHRASRLAASSTHVFSGAVGRFAKQTLGIDAAHGVDRAISVTNVTTMSGRGIAACFDGESAATMLGSPTWLRESGLTLAPGLEAEIAHARQQGRSVSAIGWNGRMVGVFEFSEALRPAARAALAACAADGREVVILTGDDSARGESLARELGFPVLAGLLPDAKVEALARIRTRRGPVAMVGDGINDAPALACSDLGIALGCGADVSRESASVCLLANDLLAVPWTIALARRTVRTIRQNLFWAFAYNSLGVGLAAAGWLNPAWAALAMVLSSALVILNSSRLASNLDPTYQANTDNLGDATTQNAVDDDRRGGSEREVDAEHVDESNDVGSCRLTTATP